jgi:anti-sigma B factor antagonist
MRIAEERGSGVVVVAPAGRVDSTTSSALETKLLGHVRSGDTRLVIDLEAVDYISSAGLRILLRAANELRPLGGTLVLCSMGDSVREVFELAGFTALFAIETSRERAVARARAEA